MMWQWARELDPSDARVNMAIEEAVFHDICDGRRKVPVVRLYTWDQAAVTVGRLQNWDDVQRQYPNSLLIRRPTGGRAVVHGNDITVSVVTDQAWLPNTGDRSVMASYRVITGAVILALNRIGVPAGMGDSAPRLAAPKTVDCFASAAPCDIVHSGTGKKLLGAAQRRDKGIILQQMSIPIEGVSGVERLYGSLRDAFERELGVTAWRDEPLDHEAHRSTYVRL